MKSVLPVLALAACVVGTPSDDDTTSTPTTDTGTTTTTTTTDPTVTDAYEQTVPAAVDVLWVIDDSCSMADEQQGLLDHVHLFFDYLLGSGIDYHVGVVTTDLHDASKSGKLQSGGTAYLWVDSNTVDPLGVFSDMAWVGVTGSALEQGLGAAYVALELERNGANAGFYRDDAALHTIVVSDEADQTDAALITSTDFVTWYDALKAVPDERSLSSAVDPTTGTTYLDVTTAIGGVVGDLSDWPNLLDRLGLETVGLERTFPLTRDPVLGTIELRVQTESGVTFYFEEAVGDPPVGDWTYDATTNSVTLLEYVPENGAIVLISYVPVP